MESLHDRLENATSLHLKPYSVLPCLNPLGSKDQKIKTYFGVLEDLLCPPHSTMAAVEISSLHYFWSLFVSVSECLVFGHCSFSANTGYKFICVHLTLNLPDLAAPKYWKHFRVILKFSFQILLILTYNISSLKFSVFSTSVTFSQYFVIAENFHEIMVFWLPGTWLLCLWNIFPFIYFRC